MHSSISISAVIIVSTVERGANKGESLLVGGALRDLYPTLPNLSFQSIKRQPNLKSRQFKDFKYEPYVGVIFYDSQVHLQC